MNTIKGTITNATPPGAPTGINKVRYQTIEITTPAGEVLSGNIGSKSGYMPGTPIEVTVEIKQDRNNQPYRYFRKFNPQYANNAAPATPAAPANNWMPTPAKQATMPPPQKAEPNWDAIAQGKVRSLFIESRLQQVTAVQLATNHAEQTAILALTEFAMTGKLIGELPNPDYVGGEQEGPAEDESNIPF